MLFEPECENEGQVLIGLPISLEASPPMSAAVMRAVSGLVFVFTLSDIGLMSVLDGIVCCMETVSVVFASEVVCEAWNDEVNGVCGFAGKVDGCAVVSVGGFHIFEWVCPSCAATVGEFRESDELPELIQMFV